MAQLNKEIDECDADGGKCAWTPAKNEHRIPQQITNQPTYGTDGTYTQGHLDVERRSRTDYAASTHQGLHEGQRAQHEVLPRHAEGREAVSAVRHTVRGTEGGRPTKGSGRKRPNGLRSEQQILQWQNMEGHRFQSFFVEKTRKTPSEPMNCANQLIDNSTLGYEDM